MAEEEGEPTTETTEDLPSISGGLEWTFKPSEVGEWSELDHDDIKDRISQKLGYNEELTDFKRDIITDFHLFNLVHTRSICLNDKQGAVFMNIMLQVLQKLHSQSQTCKYPGDSAQYPEVFEYFKQLLSAHCAPSVTRFFTLQEARLLIDFVTLTFFKHFLLYQYCLIYAREVQVIKADVQVETAHPPLPLNIAKFVPKEPAKATMVPTGYPRAPSAEKKDEKENVPLDPILQEYLEKRINETEMKIGTKIEEVENKIAG